MTTTELIEEWDAIYQTRIAILCEDREPTVEQKRIAGEEADEWVNALKREQNNH